MVLVGTNIEAQFRAIFENTVIGIVLSDTEGRFLVTNPAMQKMLGYSEEELRGIRYPVVTHPDDVALTREHSQALRTGKREHFRQQKRYVRKDGAVAWGDLTVSLVRDADGEPQFAIGMVEYITEHKRAEEELRIRTRQQAAVAELGQYALASSELTPVFQEASTLVAQILDVEHCEVWELLPEGDALLLRAGVGWGEGLVGRATVGAGKDSQAGYVLFSHGPVVVQDLRTETRFTSPSLLREHGVVSSVSVIIPGKARSFGVLGAHSIRSRNFTRDDVYFLQAMAHVLATAIERKQAEDEKARNSQELATRVLEAHEEERSRIARELHDDTVQALSTLMVNLDLLEPDLPPEAGLLTRFEHVRSIARRTLEGTRALARVMRPTILDDIGLISALQGLAKEYEESFRLPIEVQVEPTASKHLTRDLEGAIFRVAQEALMNACKHADADSVHMRLSMRDSVVELLVEDDGKGFDLNQRTHPTKLGGLGLSSMRERAILLGGELNVETVPGKGTRVALLLPLKRGIDPERQGAVAARSHTAKETTVLLVDDHAMFREGLRAVLDARPGIAVIGEAEDGRQALHMLETLHPDIAVMDIAMPNLNGLDATRQIRRHFPDVKVIILTAHETREYLVQMVKIGAAGCVLKRSVGLELASAIEAVARGQKYISPTVAGTLLDDYQMRIDHDGDDLLTEREREVLQLVAEGRTNQEIAHQLVVSVKTIEGHRTKLMRKLGAHDRTELVKYAIRMGMITPD